MISVIFHLRIELELAAELNFFPQIGVCDAVRERQNLQEEVIAIGIRYTYEEYHQ